MSTWFTMSASPPLNSYMETWMPCATVCLCVPVTLLVVPLIDKLHTCISTCTYVHLTCMSASPLWIVIWKSGCRCVRLWLCLNNPTSVPTPWLEHAHASVHVYMSPDSHVWCTPFAQLHANLCHCIFVSINPNSIPTPSLAYVFASVHVFMFIWLPILGWSPLERYIETWVSPVYYSVCVCVPVIPLLVPYLG